MKCFFGFSGVRDNSSEHLIIKIAILNKDILLKQIFLGMEVEVL